MRPHPHPGIQTIEEKVRECPHTILRHVTTQYIDNYQRTVGVCLNCWQEKIVSDRYTKAGDAYIRKRQKE